MLFKSCAKKQLSCSLIIICLIGTMIHTAVAVEKETSATGQMQNLLRIRIEQYTTGLIKSQENLIYAHQALPIFYEKRGFLPAWGDENGPLPAAQELITSINHLSSDGLRPSDYHLNLIIAETQKMKRTESLARGDFTNLVSLDLLLTDAFLVAGAHMVKGRINPERIDPEWFANLREIDMPLLLENALENRRIAETLFSLRPHHQGYRDLLDALEKYRQILQFGGWEAIPSGPALKLGDDSTRVSILRKRLAATSEFEHDSDLSDQMFDAAVEDAVIRFQNRHGLEADGVAGPETLAALNIPVERRIDQIALNLERWRWLPQDLGETHIIVNIADYTLTVHEGDRTAMDMRAIVGKPYRRTPVFSDKMTYMVFNPSWNIPHQLAIQDILPLVQKNPDYLAGMDILVISDQGGRASIIDPKNIDWESVSPRNFPYRFRQAPGPKNPLGCAKFMFPNRFNVYIHDTPFQDLFGKSSRSFSSGCIRIEKPILLAQYLLSENPSWNIDQIKATLASGIEQTVSLPKPVPVHLLYWTAWVSSNGLIHFRKDIYGRDEKLLNALALPAPENN